MTLLSVRSVSMSGENDFHLRNISFSQKKFEKIAIAGETGSGKSTLLKIIAGLVQSDSGEVIVDGEIVRGPAHALVPGNPAVAYLSQHFELPHALRVEQVLEYANVVESKVAETIYEICEIGHLLTRRTDALSGGERQRVALAKLLTTSPKLLLLDEPYSNLDPVHQRTMQAVVRKIGKRLRITCILVSHEPHDTLSWADRIIVMKGGAVVQEGTPVEIYQRPADEYVAGLFGRHSLVRAADAKPFFKLNGWKADKRSLLFRPENFRIVKKRDNVLAGVVNEVHFMGGYTDLDLSIGNAVVTARTGQTSHKPGDKVFVAVDKKRVWYL